MGGMAAAQADLLGHRSLVEAFAAAVSSYQVR